MGPWKQRQLSRARQPRYRLPSNPLFQPRIRKRQTPHPDHGAWPQGT